MPSADSVVAPPRRCQRRRSGMQERAVWREDGERSRAIGEQTAHALGERQRRSRWSRRLGRGDEDGSRAVGQNDARAGANERAAEAGAKATQAFEPLLRR